MRMQRTTPGRRSAIGAWLLPSAAGGFAQEHGTARRCGRRPLVCPRTGSPPVKLALCRRAPSAAGSPCGSKPLGTPLAVGGGIAHLPGCDLGVAWVWAGCGLGAGCGQARAAISGRRSAGSPRSLLFRYGRRDARHHSRLCCGTGYNEGEAMAPDCDDSEARKGHFGRERHFRLRTVGKERTLCYRTGRTPSPAPLPPATLDLHQARQP